MSVWLTKKKKLLQKHGRSKLDTDSAKKCIECLSNDSCDIAFAALDIIHFVCKTEDRCMIFHNWEHHISFKYFGEHSNILQHIDLMICKHHNIPNSVKQQLDDIINCASYYYRFHGLSQQHHHHRILVNIWSKLSMDYKSMHDKEIDIRSDSLERHASTVLFGAESIYIKSTHRTLLYDIIVKSSYCKKNKICTGYFRLYLNVNHIKYIDIIAAISQFYFICNATISKLVHIYQSVEGIRDTEVRKIVCNQFNSLFLDEYKYCDIAMELMHHSIFKIFVHELKSINYDEIQVDDDRFGYYNRFHLIHDGQSELETISWIIRHSLFIPEFINSGLIQIIMEIVKNGVHGNFSDKALHCLGTLLFNASKQDLLKFVNAKFIGLVLNALILFKESWKNPNGTSDVYSSINSFVVKCLHKILMTNNRYNHKIIRMFQKCNALNKIRKIRKDSEMEKHCNEIVNIINTWRSCGNGICQLTKKTVKRRHDRRFRLCSQCQNISYCSRKCQKFDWKYKHRTICSVYN